MPLALLSANPQRDLAPEVTQQRGEGRILKDAKGERCCHEDTPAKVEGLLLGSLLRQEDKAMRSYHETGNDFPETAY